LGVYVKCAVREMEAQASESVYK